jgi:hypothetical protein
VLGGAEWGDYLDSVAGEETWRRGAEWSFHNVGKQSSIQKEASWLSTPTFVTIKT